MPFEQVETNPNVVLVYTQNGGHIAFCEGISATGCSYVCHVLNDFIKSVLQGYKSN
jgi:predicted alpha/beta-fold hydrolase